MQFIDRNVLQELNNAICHKINFAYTVLILQNMFAIVPLQPSLFSQDIIDTYTYNCRSLLGLYEYTQSTPLSVGEKSKL